MNPTKRLRSVVVVAGLTLGLVDHVAAQRVTVDWSPLERVVADEMKSQGIPGAVVVIASARRLIYSSAFGVASVDTKEALTTSHLMQVGSVTKTFTALLALQLKTRGTVDFDAPIGGALPGLSPSLASLTLRDLLHQRAGLRDVAGDDGPDAEDQLVTYAKSLGDSMRVLPVGEAFSYSNAGFALAGAAVQEWAKQPFADLLRLQVLAPLGMDRSTMRPEVALASAHAVGHIGKPGDAGTVSAGIANDTRLWPAGYLWSSGDDMGRFLQAMMDDGRARSGAGLFRGVVDSAMAPAIAVPGLPNDTRYGFGVFVDRSPLGERVWHLGGVTGFSAFWAAIPASTVAVAVLTNRDGVRLESIADAALSVAIGARAAAARRGAKAIRQPRNGAGLKGRRREAAITSNSAEGTPVSRTQGRALEGTYEGRFPLELRWKEGALHLIRFGTSLKVTSLGGDRYRVQAPDEPLAEDFTIVPSRDGWPPYIQMYLWAFIRTRP